MTTTVTSQLVVHRHFAAPRHVVWAAFTHPGAIASWFGPVGFHVPVRSVALQPRPGGVLRLTMVNTRDHQLRSSVDARFTEVEPTTRLVVVEDLHDGHPPMVLRVDLADAGEGTDITLHQGPYAEHMVEMAGTGWESSFTKLDRVLAGELPADTDS